MALGHRPIKFPVISVEMRQRDIVLVRGADRAIAEGFYRFRKVLRKKT